MFFIGGWTIRHLANSAFNDRKSRYRRIKKRRRYERLVATSQLSLLLFWPLLLKTLQAKRIDRPCFLYAYWTSRSSQLLSFYSTRGFYPRWAGLRTSALFFNKCTASVKHLAWQCPRIGSRGSIFDDRPRKPHSYTLGFRTLVETPVHALRSTE